MASLKKKEDSTKRSTEDLEKYGVWVKAGPETVRERSKSKDDFDLSDLSDASTEITAEEEDLLGSLEENSGAEAGEEPLGDFDDFSFDSSEEASTSGAMDDDFSFPDIEDIQAESKISKAAGIDAE